jgi:hypothetical protein
MSRIILMFTLGLMLATQALAQNLALEGFNQRFKLTRDEAGKVSTIKLKKAVTRFSLMPFIEQIKSDLIKEQESFMALSDYQKEAEVDELLLDMGVDPYMKHAQGSEEAQKIKESLLNIKNINVDATFRTLQRSGFWKEFEAKLHEAFLFMDPTVLANLEDPRFFYKRQVTYKVVVWALDQAKKRFSSVPVLNIASFVIVRVHDMMMEQRHFHHNMLLHYFETISETELGMTKEEVDRAVSSIYEYRIDAMNIFESNRAARDWLNYGMNTFYMQVRAGNGRIRSWSGAFSNVRFQDIRKLNFAFAEVKEAGNKKIYHLHHNLHQFSSKPSLAYDFSSPTRVKRNRALLNIAGVALGFIQMPGWIKGSVENFINSFYVQQVRIEGALIGHFESTGNEEMIDRIYAQRANFYILR